MITNKNLCLDKALEMSRHNATIFDAFVKADSVINNPDYKKIMCSLSGGSDSDIMLDVLYRVDKDNKVTYVYFDTGLEYDITKQHIKYLEEKYGITIETYKPKMPIPYVCKQYGQPFLCKFVSEQIERLQSFGFQWEDEPYDVLMKKYPSGMSSALKWWCNEYTTNGKMGKYCIGKIKYLKEFLMDSPPQYPISGKCCKYAKKDLSKELTDSENFDVVCMGLRKAEGGIRSMIYENCFTPVNSDGFASYRPIFWFSDKDKVEYKELFSVVYSDLYEVYGFKRTGCAGCPYNRKYDHEIMIIRDFEPRLYKACNFVFGDSYKYQTDFKRFVYEQEKLKKQNKSLKNNKQ